MDEDLSYVEWESEWMNLPEFPDYDINTKTPIVRSRKLKRTYKAKDTPSAKNVLVVRTRDGRQTNRTWGKLLYSVLNREALVNYKDDLDDDLGGWYPIPGWSPYALDLYEPRVVNTMTGFELKGCYSGNKVVFGLRIPYNLRSEYKAVSTTRRYDHLRELVMSELDSE